MMAIDWEWQLLAPFNDPCLHFPDEQRLWSMQLCHSEELQRCWEDNVELCCYERCVKTLTLGTRVSILSPTNFKILLLDDFMKTILPQR